MASIFGTIPLAQNKLLSCKKGAQNHSWIKQIPLVQRIFCIVINVILVYLFDIAYSMPRAIWLTITPGIVFTAAS